MADYTALLEEIEEAITSVELHGQFIASEGRQYRKADLDKLREMHKYYSGLVNRQERSIFTNVRIGVPYRG